MRIFRGPQSKLDKDMKCMKRHISGVYDQVCENARIVPNPFSNLSHFAGDHRFQSEGFIMTNKKLQLIFQVDEILSTIKLLPWKLACVSSPFCRRDGDQEFEM